MEKDGNERSKSTVSSPHWTVPSVPIDSTKLGVNLEQIRQKTGNSGDIIIREFTIGSDEGLQAAIIYVDGIVNNTTINQFVMEVLMNVMLSSTQRTLNDLIQVITEKVVPIGGLKSLLKWDELYDALLLGQTILLIDGSNEALSIATSGGEVRSIDEPGTDNSIRGPREGFVESLATNISMVRRRIRNPNLWLESMTLGQVTHTRIGIMYINGIADEAIVDEAKRRLQKIKLDGILESGYIEKMIEDQNFTPFPTILATERPDTVAANLLEGKIAILVDGTPFILIIPAVFNQFFQITEDSYHRYDISIALRFLRIVMFIISMIGPSVYIAATTFHQEMIPTQLVISLVSQLEATPFTAFVEALLMEVIFEILREAGVRMPKSIGSAVSIVGALVIGQAAVQAGLVSAAMVIVVSLTAISSLATPVFSIAVSARLLRFVLMISAATFGFFGMILTLIMIIAHMCSLRSFGVPYMAPYTPVMHVKNNPFQALPIWMRHLVPKLMKRPTTEQVGDQDNA
ncbi:spore germination protein [Paenibacillus sp. G2S3]|uniref:spore germination protein n=1 Tax=Paenibacillus sp. G2S3 TaxID=3047872 RepID=UPI0024C0E8AF|nr:spore germination protein [Paenibacillus sp. G2S3]WHY17560.1 spore germination protein [Paenibacillus sp. G2S3]